MIKEVRYNLESEFETRSEGNSHVIVGYASMFRRRSQNLGGFVEEVEPGTFRKTIAESDIRALWNHNADEVLGRNRSGTLRLSEDSTGLMYEVDLPDTQRARDLRELIERGDINQSSFGFSTLDDSWGLTEDDFPLRSLKEVHLFDVSPVTYPAYLDATVGMRSLGKPALERLATARNMELADLEINLRSVISDENTTPVKTTYVVSRYFDSAEILQIRGRI